MEIWAISGIEDSFKVGRQVLKLLVKTEQKYIAVEDLCLLEMICINVAVRILCLRGGSYAIRTPLLSFLWLLIRAKPNMLKNLPIIPS